MRMNKLIVPTIFTALVCALLIGLGGWQMQRLAWKRDLIERVAAAEKAPLLSLTQALERGRRENDFALLRVRLTGRFLHGGEQHLYTLAGGRPGWRVITPLQTASGAIVLVDRGFVPHHLKRPATRAQGQIAGQVEVTGLILRQVPKAPFAPDNEPAQNEWYWRDIEAMGAAALGALAPDAAALVLIEAEAAPILGGWPRAGVTKQTLSSRHLGYAVTWFALAATALVIYGLFVRRQLMRP